MSIMLPDEFKFYHKSEPDLIYTATRHDDEYRIAWEKGDGEINTIIQTIDEVQSHIKQGYYRICNQLDKPSSILESKKDWDFKRMSKILDAIYRCSEEKLPIPYEWILELDDLLADYLEDYLWRGN